MAVLAELEVTPPPVLVTEDAFLEAMPFIETLRWRIEEQYREHPTGCGTSFGEILCYEIHSAGLTFNWLAEKWGIPVSILGELICDHCKRLEPLLVVNHNYQRAS